MRIEKIHWAKYLLNEEDYYMKRILLYTLLTENVDSSLSNLVELENIGN